MGTLILHFLGTLVITLSLISTVAHGGDFTNRRTQVTLYLHKKNQKLLKELISDGIISIRNTNDYRNTTLFEEYLMKLLAPNAYFDIINNAFISITPSKENTNKSKKAIQKIIHDTLKAFTKKEIENKVHEELEIRIQRTNNNTTKENTHAENDNNIKFLMSVYRKIKSLSIQEIRKSIDRIIIKTKEGKNFSNINFPEIYYHSMMQRPKPPIKAIQ